MDSPEVFVKKVFELVGFGDFHVDIKPEEKRGSAFIYQDENLVRQHLPAIVESMNHLLQMIAKKNQRESFFLDVNNYRRDRENLIAELARAAAKKVRATKTDVSLPAMNSYERRLVHVELAIHPDVRTESAGEGKERYVIIRMITDDQPKTPQAESEQ